MPRTRFSEKRLSGAYTCVLLQLASLANLPVEGVVRSLGACAAGDKW